MNGLFNSSNDTEHGTSATKAMEAYWTVWEPPSREVIAL
jgi:hypothetical protein